MKTESIGVNKIALITFPRSGHHFLINILMSYFESAGIEFAYCEYYSHCRTFPCSDSRLFIYKNHDFEGDIPILDDIDYIVQIRHPYMAIQSFFDISLYHDPQNIENLSSKPFKNFFRSKRISNLSYKSFNKFLRAQVSYYRRFCRKWLKIAPTFIIYEDLVNNPIEKARMVLKRIWNQEVDAEAIKYAVDSEPPWPRSAIAHPYFKLEDLKRVESECSEEMAQIGIVPIAEKIENEQTELINNPLYRELQLAYQKNHQLAFNLGKAILSSERSFTLRTKSKVTHAKNPYDFLPYNSTHDYWDHGINTERPGFFVRCTPNNLAHLQIGKIIEFKYSGCRRVIAAEQTPDGDYLIVDVTGEKLNPKEDGWPRQFKIGPS